MKKRISSGIAARHNDTARGRVIHWRMSDMNAMKDMNGMEDTGDMHNIHVACMFTCIFI